VRSAKYTTKKLPTSNLFECWELFFGVYLFGTNKSCFLFFFAECERFGRSQKRGQKATAFLKRSQKRSQELVAFFVRSQKRLFLSHCFGRRDTCDEIGWANEH
jgi:hypothetical protein